MTPAAGPALFPRPRFGGETSQEGRTGVMLSRLILAAAAAARSLNSALTNPARATADMRRGPFFVKAHGVNTGAAASVAGRKWS